MGNVLPNTLSENHWHWVPLLVEYHGRRYMEDVMSTSLILLCLCCMLNDSFYSQLVPYVRVESAKCLP